MNLNMILGRVKIPGVVQRSRCRTSEDYKLTTIGDYKIHSTALMPKIPFEKARETVETIDSTIFVNSDDTKLTFSRSLKVQNYLTTRYVGRAPLEFYGPATKMGREFVLVCPDGDSSYRGRYFGTEGSVGGYNASANELVTFER